LSVAENNPQTVPERPATAAPPQKPYFFHRQYARARLGSGTGRSKSYGAATDDKDIGFQGLFRPSS
jgi:hypothetical protein